MKRGRPPQSQIRQNIVEILHYLGQGYGYQISRIYQELFPKVTQRSVYYHLRHGLLTQETEIKRIEEEKGDFSWGPTAEKVYYQLGKMAQPQGLSLVKEFLEKKKNEIRG